MALARSQHSFPSCLPPPSPSHGGALPPLGSKLKVLSPVSHYRPDESQTPPWSYAQPASRVLPPLDGQGLAVPLFRQTCMPQAIRLPWKLLLQLGMMLEEAAGSGKK